MAKGKFSWFFIAALAVVALWVYSTLTGKSSVFTGLPSQRGLFGYDQFGNPLSPSSSGTLSS